MFCRPQKKTAALWESVKEFTILQNVMGLLQSKRIPYKWII